jgi:transposase
LKSERTAAQQAILERLQVLSEPFRSAFELAQQFLNLVRQSPRRDQAEALQSWLSEAHNSSVPPLCRLAVSLQQDQAAVEAGLSLCWSNGPVEGSNNRLKLLKRRGYGRANFDLLRRRVLQPA